jgi:hypothetical protein
VPNLCREFGKHTQIVARVAKVSYGNIFDSSRKAQNALRPRTRPEVEKSVGRQAAVGPGPDQAVSEMFGEPI